MDTIYMTSENSKTSGLHRLLISLSDGINSQWTNKYVALSNISIYYTWKNIKSNIKTVNLNYQLQGELKNLNYLIDHIRYQILKSILSVSTKKHETFTDNPPIRYINKIE